MPLNSTQDWAIRNLLKEAGISPAEYERTMQREISSFTSDEAVGIIASLSKAVEKQSKQDKREARNAQKHQSK